MGRFFFIRWLDRHKTFSALITKLTKHYIATWPSVGYSGCYFQCFGFDDFSSKLVIHFSYIILKKRHIFQCIVLLHSVCSLLNTQFYCLLMESNYHIFICCSNPYKCTIFPSMLSTAKPCSYIFQESDWVHSHPRCFIHSFAPTQLHSHLSRILPQLSVCVAVFICMATAYT